MWLLQILYTLHKLLRIVTKANPSVDNRLYSTSQKRSECVSKSVWKRVSKKSWTWWYVLKTSWKDLCKTSSKRLEDVLKTSWRCLEDVLKTSWQDVWKTSWRHLEIVLKTSWRCMTKTIMLVLIKTS